MLLLTTPALRKQEWCKEPVRHEICRAPLTANVHPKHSWGKRLSSADTADELRTLTSSPTADKHQDRIHELFHLGISPVSVRIWASSSSSDSAPSGLGLRIKEKKKPFLATTLSQSPSGNTGVEGREDGGVQEVGSTAPG